jgi:imidazolonepropionase-like amidohydrolase
VARSILFAFLFALAPLAATPAKTPEDRPVAILNVNVIPMDKERVLRNQIVIVRGGVISAIGDAKKVGIPKNAQRIEGKNKFLIPGLTDMHVHLMSDEDEFPDALAEDELKIMKRADLVLLEANPLDDISNTERRAGVMINGRYFPQAEMNKWLDEIAPRFQKALDGQK